MKFILNNDRLSIEEPELKNSGSFKYYLAQVETNEQWEGLTIEARIVPKEGSFCDNTGKAIAVINNQLFVDNALSGYYAIGFIGYSLEFIKTADTKIVEGKVYYTKNGDNYEIVENPVESALDTYYEQVKSYQISTNLVSVWFNKGAGEIEVQDEDIPTPSQWEIYIAQIQEIANEASQSAEDAESSAGIATQQAGIATSQAQEATRQAGISKSYAEESARQAQIASDEADRAEQARVGFEEEVQTATTNFNNNATQKTSDFNSNATSKTNEYNTNATEKTNSFNTNASNKTTSFNNNATQKETDFNTNATEKTTTFNENATQKTDSFNTNANEKTTEFDENAQEKLDEFNENAESYNNRITELESENESLKSQLPTGTGTGEHITLNDSAGDINWKSIKPNGKTVQDGEPTPETPVEIKNVEGYNLIDLDDFVSINPATTTTIIDTVINVKNVTTGYGSKIVISNLKQNTDYYIQYVYKNISNGINKVRVFAGTGQTTSLASQDNGNGFTFNTGSNTTINCWFYAGLDTIAEVEYTDIQLSEGTAPRLWVPYNSIEFKVQNKNLFNPESKLLNLTNIASYSYDNGIYTIIPKTSGIVQFRMSLYLLPGSYVFNSSLVTASNIIIRNETSVIKTLSSYTNQTFTTTNKVDRILFNLNSPDGISPIILNLSDLQIEQGSTASSYVAHQEQTSYFTFEEGQYLAEGGYLADDGIHNVYGQILLNGTENWIRAWTSSSSYVFRCADNLPNTPYEASPSYAILVYSNKYERRSVFGTVISGEPNTIYADKTNDNAPYLIGLCNGNEGAYAGLGGQIFIKHQNITTADDFKAYLTEQYANGTPVIVQYQLKEEIITPYTPTQQAQWNAIKKMKTYKNVSHISTEGGTLEPSLDVVYYKDLETLFNNMTA